MAGFCGEGFLGAVADAEVAGSVGAEFDPVAAGGGDFLVAQAQAGHEEIAGADGCGQRFGVRFHAAELVGIEGAESGVFGFGFYHDAKPGEIGEFQPVVYVEQAGLEEAAGFYQGGADAVLAAAGDAGGFDEGADGGFAEDVGPQGPRVAGGDGAEHGEEGADIVPDGSRRNVRGAGGAGFIAVYNLRDGAILGPTAEGVEAVPLAGAGGIEGGVKPCAGGADGYGADGGVKGFFAAVALAGQLAADVEGALRNAAVNLILPAVVNEPINVVAGVHGWVRYTLLQLVLQLLLSQRGMVCQSLSRCEMWENPLPVGVLNGFPE